MHVCGYCGKEEPEIKVTVDVLVKGVGESVTYRWHHKCRLEALVNGEATPGHVQLPRYDW